jgi:hypothetical protein
MKRFERCEADYALLNDIAHGWQAVFYYTDRDTQSRQIEGAGLSLIEVLADDGSVLEKSSDDSKSGLLHYICQKPGNAST